MNVVLRAAAAASKYRLARQLASCSIGAGTNFLAWRVRGAKECHLEVGSNCFIRDKIVFEKEGARLVIGSRTFLGNGLIAVAERVEIGSDVMFGWGVTLVDHNSHGVAFSSRAGDTERWLGGTKDWSRVKISPVIIEDKVWVGFDAVIMKGVTVGEGAVIGARAVVSKSVAPWTIVAGNPAQVVRTLDPTER